MYLICRERHNLLNALNSCIFDCIFSSSPTVKCRYMLLRAVHCSWAQSGNAIWSHVPHGNILMVTKTSYCYAVVSFTAPCNCHLLGRSYLSVFICRLELKWSTSQSFRMTWSSQSGWLLSSPCSAYRPR